MARLFPMVFGTTQVKNFTSNTTFPMPAGVTSLTVTGKGAAGQPGYENTYIQWYLNTYEIYKTYYGDGTVQTEESNQPVSTTPTSNGNPRSPYCDPYEPYNQPNIGNVVGYQTCYRFEKFGEEVTEYVPPTTGAAASGFNKTFPGGAGGPAVSATYTNVPVTPGTSYQVVVPAGGSITITYIS